MFNFAVPSGGSHALAELIRYAIASLRPDRVVVYFPAHHVQPSVGVTERMGLLDGNLAYRLLVTTHFEALLSLIPPLVHAFSGTRSGETPARQFREGLDGVREAAGATPLVIVSDMRDGSHRDKETLAMPPAVAPRWFLEWGQAHPEVTRLDVADDPAWQAADTQPNHHWTPEGIRTVMGVLASRLAPLLVHPPAP